MKGFESLRRGEVRRVTDTARESMDDAEKAAETAADDHDVAVDTLEALSGAMTDEGLESVRDGLDGAEGAAEDDFADHDAEQDRPQDDADDRAAELDDHGESAESDVVRILDAAREVALHSVRDHLDRTAEADQEDVDFLSEAAEQDARTARQASGRKRRSRRGWRGEDDDGGNRSKTRAARLPSGIFIQGSAVGGRPRTQGSRPAARQQ